MKEKTTRIIYKGQIIVNINPDKSIEIYDLENTEITKIKKW